MTLKQLLFPASSRQLPGQRWLKITLRTLHLVGVGGLGGGFLYEVAPEQWLPYWGLAVVTGVCLVLIELWSNAIWLLQWAGAAIVFKLFLLASLHFFPQAAIPIFISVIIISGVISHAPAKIRHRLVFSSTHISPSQPDGKDGKL
ncbi:hypothetical protein [Thioflexithrix psekupsensis]|nr:hypothetical protein [Thioflexithrix psekupsensis]